MQIIISVIFRVLLSESTPRNNEIGISPPICMQGKTPTLITTELKGKLLTCSVNTAALGELEGFFARAKVER